MNLKKLAGYEAAELVKDGQVVGFVAVPPITSSRLAEDKEEKWRLGANLLNPVPGLGVGHLCYPG